MEFPYLFFFLVNALHLFFCFLGELFELFFHSRYFIDGLSILIIFNGFVLS